MKKVFRRIIPGADDLKDHMTASEVPEWDSLKHILLITEIEKEFNITFSLDDMLNMQSFDDIFTAVTKKLS